MLQRPLGSTGLHVSAIALGCWPIAGMTSLNVTESDSLATLAACPDLGINFLDTAYCYGRDGQSERLIARALGHRRDALVIATKAGIHWDAGGGRVLDARPQTIKHQCDLSLQRLGTDRVDLLYLHAPDPHTAIEDSAGALRELMDAGKTRSVGVSNLSLEQHEAFAAVCPITATQPPFNMLMRGIEADLVPWCVARQVSVVVYWPLMKGLLAGKLSRDHVWQPGDGRAKYPMFQGDEWQKNHDLLDRLRPIAHDAGVSLAQLVIHWTIHQPGVTAALCGAKRVDQITENAGAADCTISDEQRARIDAALAARGQPLTVPPV